MKRDWFAVGGLMLASLLATWNEKPANAENTNRLYKASFTAAAADPEATRALGNQRAFVDPRVPSQNRLVVFLHGAGVSENCGPSGHLKLLASYGFHVFSPCYVSNYGVENCGDNIAGCRLEAFDGVDRHAAIDIQPADSIERRVTNGLRYLEQLDPGHGWIDFLAENGQPRWDEIVLTGHSHGASTAALIGKMHQVHRVVLLSGPYDVGQDWFDLPPLTEPERYYGLTHQGDKQHLGHLNAYELLDLPGEAIDIDRSSPPYNGSHRLLTAVMSEKPHSAVHAGRWSPKSEDQFVLDPVWRYLYGVGR